MQPFFSLRLFRPYENRIISTAGFVIMAILIDVARTLRLDHDGGCSPANISLISQIDYVGSACIHDLFSIKIRVVYMSKP